MTGDPTPPTQELPVEAPGTAATAPRGPEHRYRALAGAVRRHEATSSHPCVPKRPADHALYGVLTRLETEPPVPRDS